MTRRLGGGRNRGQLPQARAAHCPRRWVALPYAPPRLLETGRPIAARPQNFPPIEAALLGPGRQSRDPGGAGVRAPSSACSESPPRGPPATALCTPSR